MERGQGRRGGAGPTFTSFSRLSLRPKPRLNFSRLSSQVPKALCKDRRNLL